MFRDIKCNLIHFFLPDLYHQLVILRIVANITGNVLFFQSAYPILQSGYGGECPMPVISASTPSDCFAAVYEAVRISVQHMTPVIFLSDGYIANGAEPWKFPTSEQLATIEVNFKKELGHGEEKFMTYQRDEKLVRPWAIPGTPGLSVQPPRTTRSI